MDGVKLSAELQHTLEPMGPVAVAVSGGVDSMTLATAAHNIFGPDMLTVHAVSPAVPPRATARVKSHAARLNWPLKIVNAGEFKDDRYLANPVNRCFYCKFNLYACIASLTDLQIVSGTNVDDLSDFRPGLKAATEHKVRHPFVEAGIDKKGVRMIARHFDLQELADLPAGPCLSSRLETGVKVTPARLQFVDRVEEFINDVLVPDTVRCRVLSQRVEIQLDIRSLKILQNSAMLREHIISFISTEHHFPVSFAPYRLGSAVIGRRAEQDVILDLDRESRIGLPEAIMCEGKTVEQIMLAVTQAEEAGKNIFLTRLDEIPAQSLSLPLFDYDPTSRTAIAGPWTPPAAAPSVAVVVAGTSDLQVAREAVRTLAFHGIVAREYIDVGIAGLWRLLRIQEELKTYAAIIAVAGMEGGLFSVLGGLVPGLVIAVPTSRGYGICRQGETALHSALASCAQGIVAVNIDNGYGAACAVTRMLGRANER